MEALCHSGYVQSHLDYSLFKKRSNTGLIMALDYIDDLVITSSDSILDQETKHELHIILISNIW